MITDSLDLLNIQWIFTDSYLRIIKSDGGFILVWYHLYVNSNICIQSVVKNLFTTSKYKICIKSRDFLNVGKNVQYTPFGTLTSDSTYVYSDTGNISFSTFVRLLRWDSVDSTSRTQLTVVFTPPKDHFCGIRYSFFIMYEILYASLLKLTFYRDCKFVCKRSDILKVSRSLVSTDVMYLKIMIKTVQLVKFQSQHTKYEKITFWILVTYS